MNHILSRHLGMVALFLLAGCPELPPGDSPPPSEDRSSEVDLLVAPLLDDGWTVGLIVGLLHADGTTETHGYGSVEVGGAAPDATTLFEIGSISKVFTSLALADMALEGTVALDQPVAELLPAAQVTMPVNGAPITLEHLSTHTSGLPRLPDNIAPRVLADPYADYEVADLYEFLNGHSLTAAPGARWEYSNLAVGLLGHALALTDGASWEQQIVSRICEPLGLDDTVVTVAPGQEARFAQGHDGNLDPALRWNFGVLAGLGALRSTATDLLDFLAAQAGIVQSDLTPAMESTHQGRYQMSAEQEIGLAWFVTEGRYVWHNGGTGGFGVIAGFDLQTQTGVVVLSNTYTDYAVEVPLGIELLKLVAGEPYAAPEIPPTLTLSPEEVERYTGRFVIPGQGGFDVVLRDGALFLELPGQQPHRMHASATDTFYLRIAVATISYECVAEVCDSISYEQAGAASFTAERQ